MVAGGTARPGPGGGGPAIRVANAPGFYGDRPAACRARSDPQAKALGELLRARFADVPRELLSGEAP